MTQPRDSLFSGWRRAGILNTALIWVLTITVATLLFNSTWRLGSGWSSIRSPVLLFKGGCSKGSQINLALHAVANGIALLVLASSNFFMQILCSPTRKDIDKAYSQYVHLEIGVQSVKNLFFIPKVRSALWLLLAITSVPLHLYSNACLTESKTSTDAYLVIATESFVTRSVPFYAPGAGHYSSSRTNRNPNTTLLNNLTLHAAQWEHMTFNECLSTYNDPSNSLTRHRNVVMIVRNKGENETAGWNMSAIRSRYYQWPSDLNSLWKVKLFNRTDTYASQRRTWLKRIASEYYYTKSDEQFDWLQYRIKLDTNTSTIPLGPDDLFRPNLPPLEVMYCLSEPFVADCELWVQNTPLLAVSVFCLVKSAVCLTTILLLRQDNPMATLGDAIESFISEPDPSTSNMCWASRRPGPHRKRWHFQLRPPPWIRGPRRWKTRKRRLEAVVPEYIWVFTFGISLVLICIAIDNVRVRWDVQPWYVMFSPAARSIWECLLRPMYKVGIHLRTKPIQWDCDVRQPG